MYSAGNVAHSADDRSVARLDAGIPASRDVARRRRGARLGGSAAVHQSAQFGRDSPSLMSAEASQELFEACLPDRLLTDANQLRPIASGRLQGSRHLVKSLSFGALAVGVAPREQPSHPYTEFIPRVGAGSLDYRCSRGPGQGC
jgi:hypothetical protein